MRAALTMVDDGRSLTPETVELLGAGWVAEETLAISLFCALGRHEPAEAMSSSASHGGDSDSTGSLTGNLLGAALGAGWLDESLLAQLEGRSVIEQVGSDLIRGFGWNPAMESSGRSIRSSSEGDHQRSSFD